MRVLMRCLVPVCAIAALGTGCASNGSPDADRTPKASQPSVGPDDCSSHIDTLIEARIVPRSDRDYAFQMCELNR